MLTINLKEIGRIFLLALVVLLSRLPFLSAGYGVEEDSWGIAVAAYHTKLYGVMEASRLPGHPVNEFIYSLFWGYGAWLYNFFSALCSVLSVLFFYLICKQLNVKHFVWASLAFAFTPVVYINSTCTIDYLWALMFAVIAFYALINNKFLLAGVLLGLGVSCRINTIILFLPMLIWMFYYVKRSIFIKKAIIFSVVSGLTTLICFAPIMYEYGVAFFSYSDQFPYPSISKIIYKATIGVWGLVGVLGILAMLIVQVIKRDNSNLKPSINLFFICLVGLQVWTYLLLPQKSAYLALIVPFTILWLGHFLAPKYFRIACVSMVVSSFVFSVNLTDSFRGSTYSKLAIKTTVSNQEIFLDPLTGPVYSDYTKRVNKMDYTLQVLKQIETINYPTIIICGWWFNQILIQQMDVEPNSMVKFVFYFNPETMQNYMAKGYQIYYLAEQDEYNDLFYKFNRTKSLASPFLLGSKN